MLPGEAGGNESDVVEARHKLHGAFNYAYAWGVNTCAKDGEDVAKAALDITSPLARGHIGGHVETFFIHHGCESTVVENEGAIGGCDVVIYDADRPWDFDLGKEHPEDGTETDTSSLTKPYEATYKPLQFASRGSASDPTTSSNDGAES